MFDNPGSIDDCVFTLSKINMSIIDDSVDISVDLKMRYSGLKLNKSSVY